MEWSALSTRIWNSSKEWKEFMNILWLKQIRNCFVTHSNGSHTFVIFFFFGSLMTWSRLIDSWETWDDREMYTMQKISCPSSILRRQLIQSFFFFFYLPVSHCWSFNLRPWERTNISSYSSCQSRSPLLSLHFFRQPFLHFIFLCVVFVCCFCIFLLSCVFSFALFSLEDESTCFLSHTLF